MNQRRTMRSALAGFAALALWACTESSEPGDSPSAGNGSGSTAAGSGATTAGVASSTAAGQNSGGATAAGTTSAATAGTATSAGVGGTGQSGSGSAGGPPGGTTGSAGAANATCPTSITLKAGDNNKVLMMGTLQRTYLVHAPPGYTGKSAVPVVFDFHGLSGNGAQQKSLSRWDKVGDSEGFIVVYPDGVDKAWNAGLCCSDDKSIDDVAFVRAMIKALQTDACIDPTRVYATGCSNGGGMSYKLACEAADVIAGVAPVDFDCVDGNACAMCKPARPITEVQFRGTSDQLVAYAGSGAFIGAKKNFELWGGLNMCTGSPAALTANAACEAYPMCGGGTETVLCTVQNGAHCGSYSSFMIPQVAWGVLKNAALP